MHYIKDKNSGKLNNLYLNDIKDVNISLYHDTGTDITTKPTNFIFLK